MRDTTKGPAYDSASQRSKQSEYANEFRKFLHYGNPGARILLPSLDEEKARGYDFIVEFAPGSPANYTVELKTDFVMKDTGNLAFEVISEAYTGWGSTLGWGFSTQADWLAYIEAGPDTVRIIDPDDLRAYVIDTWWSLKTRPVKNMDGGGRYIYTTLIALVPLRDIEFMIHAVGNLRAPGLLEIVAQVTDRYTDLKGDRYGGDRTVRDRRIKSGDWANFQRADL